MTLSSVIREDPCEFLGAITSFVTFLSDLLTDLTVAGFYFYYGHLNWGLLTLLLIFVPGMIHITSFTTWYSTQASSSITSSHYYVELLKSSVISSVLKDRAKGSEDPGSRSIFGILIGI